jgi:AbrB family looped-hinge helix DNA binding protein
MSIVTTSIKGQVVIPKKEREKLGLKPGSKLMVKAAGDHIELYPLPENPVEYFCGIFAEGPSLAEALLKDRKEETRREEEKIARHLRSSGLSKKRR